MNFLNNINTIILENRIYLALFLLVIIVLTYHFNFSKHNIFSGGSIDDNPKLNSMINNGILTDEQKMKELEETNKKAQIKVTKFNNIYNNLLTNLSSNEEEIETAEMDLADAKNHLTLSEINLALKNSLILLKKNKNPNKLPLLEFNVALNKSKQYNIQTIISFHKTKQLRKNTLKSPKDTFFKTELLNSINESIKYAQQSHIKAKKVYTLCISTTNPDIIKYKADLNNSKNLAKNLEENIINIKNRIDEKYKLQDSIKEKLLIKKNTLDNKILFDEQDLNTKKDKTEKNIEEDQKVIKENISTTPPPQNNSTILDTIENLFNF